MALTPRNRAILKEAQIKAFRNKFVKAAKALGERRRNEELKKRAEASPCQPKQPKQPALSKQAMYRKVIDALHALKESK